MNKNETWGQAARRYLNAPDVSFWMKRAINDLLLRDPVDAMKDAEALSELMERRCNEILESSQAKFK